jgi:hypothetical protein
MTRKVVQGMIATALVTMAVAAGSNCATARSVLITNLCGRANAPKTCMWKCVRPGSDPPVHGYCLWICPPYVPGHHCVNKGWAGTSSLGYYYFY